MYSSLKTKRTCRSELQERGRSAGGKPVERGRAVREGVAVVDGDADGTRRMERGDGRERRSRQPRPMTDRAVFVIDWNRRAEPVLRLVVLVDDDRRAGAVVLVEVRPPGARR